MTSISDWLLYDFIKVLVKLQTTQCTIDVELGDEPDSYYMTVN